MKSKDTRFVCAVECRGTGLELKCVEVCVSEYTKGAGPLRRGKEMTVGRGIGRP